MFVVVSSFIYFFVSVACPKRIVLYRCLSQHFFYIQRPAYTIRAIVEKTKTKQYEYGVHCNFSHYLHSSQLNEIICQSKAILSILVNVHCVVKCMYTSTAKPINSA